MDEKIPECCGESDWVAHCKHCWDGTMPQPTRELAIEAWRKESYKEKMDEKEFEENYD